MTESRRISRARNRPPTPNRTPRSSLPVISTPAAPPLSKERSRYPSAGSALPGGARRTLTTGWPAPGFAAARVHVMRVRPRTESMSSETALRSGPERSPGATTVACVRSLAMAGVTDRRRKASIRVTDVNIARVARPECRRCRVAPGVAERPVPSGRFRWAFETAGSPVPWRVEPARGFPRAAQELAVTERRFGNARDGAREGWFVLSAAQAEREGEIAGADEEGVDSRRGGDGVDFVECRRLFDHADGEDLPVGGVIVVARHGPSADGGPGSRSAPAGGRISAGGGAARGPFPRARARGKT